MYKQYEQKLSNEELAPGRSVDRSQCRDDIKGNDLFDKLSGVLMISGFETTLIEGMLKEMYCRDKKAIDKYEKIRSMAIMKAKKQFGEIQAGKELERQETIRTLSNEVERLSMEVDVLTQGESALQESYKDLYGKFTKLKADYNEMAAAVKSYEKLNQWQELRIKEVPKIRKKNSGIIRVQNWESAVTEFEYYNKKPSLPQIDIK